MHKKMLSDVDVWNRLQHAIEALSGEEGETAIGAEALAFARLYLVLLQHKLLKDTDGLTMPSNGDEPEIATLSVRLPKEAIDALRRLAADSFPPKFNEELVAFILGRYLAKTGHFHPRTTDKNTKKFITITLHDEDFAKLEKMHVEARTSDEIDDFVGAIVKGALSRAT